MPHGDQIDVVYAVKHEVAVRDETAGPVYGRQAGKSRDWIIAVRFADVKCLR